MDFVYNFSHFSTRLVRGNGVSMNIYNPDSAHKTTSPVNLHHHYFRVRNLDLENSLLKYIFED